MGDELKLMTWLLRGVIPTLSLQLSDYCLRVSKERL